MGAVAAPESSAFGRRVPLLLAALVFAGAGAGAQQAPQSPREAASDGDGLAVTFLFNYYDQDGDRSPVTGGIGTEDLQVAAPTVLINWPVSENWRLNFEVGADSITSASTNNMDVDGLQSPVLRRADDDDDGYEDDDDDDDDEYNELDGTSSASLVDVRGYLNATATRSFERSSVSLFTGFSAEWDYRSVAFGGAWTYDVEEGLRSFTVGLRHFFDIVDLYEIDGVQRGQSDRDTTDLSLSFTSVLSRRAVGMVEVSAIEQSGFLSTPFHEVVFAPSVPFPRGEVVAERLPDSRRRYSVGLGLNHMISRGVVHRPRLRWYEDDWNLEAQSFDYEVHFRLPTEREMWAFPIFRYHTQSGTDYYGRPGDFSRIHDFYTADPDLSEFDLLKYGFGIRFQLPSVVGKRFEDMEVRLNRYDRDDGFEAVTISFAVGTRFWGGR